MQKILVGLFVLFLPTLAIATPGSDPAGAVATVQLERRLAALEAQQAELYHTLAEKKAAGLASSITERLTFSGLLEIEAAAENLRFADGSSITASDLAVATVQFGLGAKLSENLSGNIILLYEEDATALDVDEATIDFAQGDWSARIGRQYLPFGAFHSHFISDPLTLALGETSETALRADYSFGPVTLSAFAFNGNTEKIGADDRISDWGTRLVVMPATGIELGASFISDLADSNAELLSEYSRRVGGWSAYFHLEAEHLRLEAEYLAATGAFAAADLDANFDQRGDRPQTWNLEAAWMLTPVLKLAARYEGSSEFAGQPERQYGLATSWSPAENVTLALEYLRGTFDHAFGVDVDGNILDKRDLVSAQLAIAF